MPLPAELRPILWFLLSRRLSVLLVRHAPCWPHLPVSDVGTRGRVCEQPQAGLRVPLPFQEALQSSCASPASQPPAPRESTSLRS